VSQPERHEQDDLRWRRGRATPMGPGAQGSNPGTPAAAWRAPDRGPHNGTRASLPATRLHRQLDPGHPNGACPGSTGPPDSPLPPGPLTRNQGPTWPPRGSGAAAPGGALRAIDATARPLTCLLCYRLTRFRTDSNARPSRRGPTSRRMIRNTSPAQLTWSISARLPLGMETVAWAV